MTLDRADDLVDGTYTGVQDVQGVVEVLDRHTGDILGRATTGVALRANIKVLVVRMPRGDAAKWSQDNHDGRVYWVASSKNQLQVYASG